MSLVLSPDTRLSDMPKFWSLDAGPVEGTAPAQMLGVWKGTAPARLLGLWRGTAPALQVASPMQM